MAVWEIKMIDVRDYPNISTPMSFFEAISKIPRGSGNTRGIADYLVGFAKERGLFVKRDGADNVIIKKAATVGLESRPTVVLQGHTDIVAEKVAGCLKDMEKEGVDIYRDGDSIRARGTTLGADDGVAVAYMLALLDSRDIPHPAIEAVFTSDEETGLIGAKAICPEDISGRIMINLDSGEDGIFTAGCAGGIRADVSLPIKRDGKVNTAYSLSLLGLLGGHSGVEIDKGRANAVKVIAELLSRLPDLKLISLSGGNADNAIPREAEAVFTTSAKPCEETLSALAKELCPDEEVRLVVKEVTTDESAVTKEDSSVIISLVRSMPTGVVAMSKDIDGLVETSLNVGVIRLFDSELSLTVSLRSSVGKSKLALLERVTEVAASHGARVNAHSEYPAWEYRRESHLREVTLASYERIFGKRAEVVVIHAGLECGIFSDKLKGLDCLSFGPAHYDIHTPDEHLSVSSFSKTWELLLDVLKNI